VRVSHATRGQVAESPGSPRYFQQQRNETQHDLLVANYFGHERNLLLAASLQEFGKVTRWMLRATAQRIGSHKHRDRGFKSL